jgi:hypothetical protein
MARLIWRWCLPLFLTCTLISGVMMAFASTLKVAQAHVELPGFDACQLPCWAGITPSETEFDQAVHILQANIPDARTLVKQAVISFGTIVENSVLSGGVYAVEEKVSTIQLNVVLPLHELMQTLGSPDCVRVLTSPSSPDWMMLYWTRGKLIVKTLLAANPWGRLEVDSTAQSLEIGPEDGSCRSALHWQGFAPVWSYAVQ